MQKLPLFDVIGNTYRFLFREWWTILRLSWFPLLIVTVVNFYVGWVTMTRMGAVFQGAPTDIFSGVSQNVTLSGISALVMMLGTAIVAVALHRVILFGDRKPEQYIYFAFDRVEGLFFLLPLVVTVAGIALMLLGIVPSHALCYPPNTSIVLLFSLYLLPSSQLPCSKVHNVWSLGNT